jgi:hypothetical protein
LAQLFSQRANAVPRRLLAGLGLLLVALVAIIWYYFSPWYTDVGYAPAQPVPYSHKQHAGDLGMDCRYCHTGVEKASVAMVPPTQTCMNCHTLVKPSSKKLVALKESWDRKLPMQWVRVHKLPDYAYFDHSAHLRAGVGCESCHGNVAAMEVVTQKQPLSMAWCLDCHRNPGPHLRPQSELTVMDWKAPADQAVFAARVTKELSLRPPTNCSGCHR